MRLKELTAKLEELKEEGYIESMRSSSTGIGYTFETILKLDETNIPIPDLGGRAELKTTRKDASGIEEFHYNEAYLLTEPSVRGFKRGFREKSIKLDLRMHLKETGAVRNRGTGFRVKERDMIKLYSSNKRLI